MNLIPKICELLCVEIDEEFKISQNGEVIDNGTLYKFNGAWFFKHNNDTDDWDLCCDSTLLLLLNGHIEIFKLPFEPKDGEKYWTVYWKGIVDMPCAVYGTWRGDSCDFANKVSGNCFRTEAEAEKHKYEVYEKLTGKKWEE